MINTGVSRGLYLTLG